MKPINHDAQHQPLEQSITEKVNSTSPTLQTARALCTTSPANRASSRAPTIRVSSSTSQALRFTHLGVEEHLRRRVLQSLLSLSRPCRPVKACSHRPFVHGAGKIRNSQQHGRRRRGRSPLLAANAARVSCSSLSSAPPPPTRLPPPSPAHPGGDGCCFWGRG